MSERGELDHCGALFAAKRRNAQWNAGRDRGSATVAALTLCFAFMAGALIWLSRTVDQSVHDRTQAASVAFQAARAGAQEVDLDDDDVGTVVLHAPRATEAVRRAATELLAANGDTGEVTDIAIAGATVTVTVTITTTGRPSVGVGTAVARAGFDRAGQ